MRLGDFELNFSFDNEWKGIQALWNKDFSWNWYDMTLIQLNGNYINYKNIKPAKVKFHNDLADLEEIFNSTVNPLYSIEINVGLIGFTMSINLEKFLL